MIIKTIVFTVLRLLLESYKKDDGMFANLQKMATFATANAEIAQLVEHNLAKVRVASSSLVFRSNIFDILE